MSSKRDPEKIRVQNIRFCYDEMTKNITLPSMRGLEQGRLDRALELALSADSLKKYDTTWGTCLCPDAGYRGITWICKHRLAYMMRRRERLAIVLYLDEPLYDSTESL